MRARETLALRAARPGTYNTRPLHHPYPPVTNKTAATEHPHARRVLLLMFVTLFVDLVGFSIIFPLFPQMLEYYTALEGNHGLMRGLIDGLERFTQWAGAPGEFGIVVLFGGVLSALYSLLQFFCAPIFGSISDRVGRKPVLLVSIAGIAVSYAVWFFAGTFTLLVVGRTLGGIMAANISTASAVVADVTDERSRSRGMALIGVAFGLGFIVGPALGGVSALWDPTESWPGLVEYGVNPFSGAALAAFVLAAFNFFFVLTRFPETLRKESRRPVRFASPMKLFRTEDYPGVTATNLTNFLFLTVFSGMEFSLTFLARDRLDYTAQQNIGIFLFVGLTLALVQGGYVRRYSARIGTRRMAVHGLICCYPGLILIGLTGSSPTLYAGLFFMAIGGAQVLPCLTALASVYAPAEDQGRILGIFRSLGALARAIGPLIACLAYWRLGPTMAYHWGAFFLTLPLFLMLSLPEPAADREPASDLP